MAQQTNRTDPNPQARRVSLRDVHDDDLPIFFEQQLDVDANHMAAFTSRDPFDWEAFLAHWHVVLADPANRTQTILVDEDVAGHIALYPESEEEYDIGYWLGRDFWGQGVATAALGVFLREITRRPIFARAVKDNIGSLRVLEKNGFQVVDHVRSYANARGTLVDECVLRLD